MAITFADVEIWKRLKSEGAIPQRPELLEIGQSNWYNDVPLSELIRLRAAGGTTVRGFADLYDAASHFYAEIFAPSSTVAIDLHGKPDALPLDLNEPHPELNDRFDIVINGGTSEHCFDQSQVFRTIHGACRLNGLMLHGVPSRGWLDHSFYNYHPTFFLDLAAANKYKLILLAGFKLGTNWLRYFSSLSDIHARERCGTLPQEMMLYCVFRKVVNKPFAKPMQGFYTASLSESEMQDWHTLR